MLNKKVVAIHQPNFFPWMGYFSKIQQADIFVFLDDVPVSNSSSYCTRVQINIQNTPKFIFCPTQKVSGVQYIKNLQIHEEIPWREKLIKTLQITYGKSKNFKTCIKELEKLIFFNSSNLTDFNINAILNLSKQLGYSTIHYRQSDLATEKNSTELMIEIVKKVGGNTYLCGNGSGGYLNEDLFKEQNVLLQYQNFQPTVYGNIKTFIPGLSIIDYLMNS